MSVAAAHIIFISKLRTLVDVVAEKANIVIKPARRRMFVTTLGKRAIAAWWTMGLNPIRRGHSCPAVGHIVG